MSTNIGRVCPLACVLLAVVCLPQARVLAQYDHDQPPINYSKAKPNDPVAALQRKLAAGKAELVAEGELGYLRSLLTALDIPISSQSLVFSKTSLQRDRINPRMPRAIYFNDETYVGYVRGGDVLEIATTDPAIGTVFYTLDQVTDAKPALVKQTDSCFQCHVGSMTRDVPGLMMRSVYPDPAGQPILTEGSKLTTHDSPFKERFGGWYVTGRHGGYDVQKHMGNLIGRSRDKPEPIDPKAGSDVTDLRPLFATAAYPTQHSDLIALMVLSHQVEAHNLMTRANYACQFALRDSKAMNKALGRPIEELSESTHRRINSPAESLLEYFLFCEEPALAAPIEGTTSFAKEFADKGPLDSKGRSLRDWDLQRRMFKYPLSYLIYSAGFDGLPQPTKDYVYGRLYDVLSGKAKEKKFEHLSADQRQAILEILRETKKDLPVYWRK